MPIGGLPPLDSLARQIVTALVLSSGTRLALLGGMYEFLELRAVDEMSANPVAIGPGTSLREAAALFKRHDFNGFPIVSGKLLLGWFTKFDFLAAFRVTDDSIFPQYELLMERPVSDAMTPARAVLTVTPRTPLSRVLEKMVRHQVRSFPVIDDGRLVGVISREDVLRGLAQATGHIEPRIH